MSNILITGIAGFIGSHLAEALRAQGHDVVGIDNLSTGRAENWPGAVIGDIRDPGAFPLGAWDVVYHCAASYKDRSDWEGDASTNVAGTLNVIREAQHSDARLVYFQTSLCYGPHPFSPVGVQDPLDPHGSYAISKTAGEAFIRDSGLPYVSLRLANMYGPRNLSGPVPAFYQRLSQGEPCTVVDSRRDFVFIDDLIEVAVAAATKGSGAYNVSSGTDQPILSVYAEVRHAMGIEEAPTFQQPRGPDDVATLLLDPSRTEQDFGWRAHTPLDVGIAAAVGWYDAHPVTETYTHLAGVK